jgi:hypothetical protein
MQRRTTRGHRNRIRQHTGPDGSVISDGLAALREQARAQASSLLGRVKAGGEELLNVRKLHAAEELATIGGAIRRAADTLHGRGRSGGAADYADSLAERVEHAARYLERVDVDDLIADVQDAVQKQPAIFLTGMFLVGVAAARFIKATEPPKRPKRRTRTS